MNTYKVEVVDADTLHVRGYDEDGALTVDQVVERDEAEHMAEAILAAEEAALAVGTRVTVGADPVVLSEYYGQTGVIESIGWFGNDEMSIVRFGNERVQVVQHEYLTVEEDDEDADDAQRRALYARLIEEGVRVTVAEDAEVVLAGGEVRDDDVYFGGEVEGTISEWPTTHTDYYDTTQNFYVVTDDGEGQVVAIHSTKAVDLDTVDRITREVGAQFAERRGLTVGASVELPGFLDSILFGTGTIQSIEDGMATVRLAEDLTQEHPLFILTRADG